MSMLEFPTFEEMVAQLSSPLVPVTGMRDTDIELSTDDMIKEMFQMMKHPEYNAGTGIGGSKRDQVFVSADAPANPQVNDLWMDIS